MGGSIMSNYQLELIREYCDTTGVRLSSHEKDLLCMVLENPVKYDGFESSIFIEHREGKDYRGRWDAASYRQYRINIDDELSIDERYKNESDGVIQDRHWNCESAYHITDTREMVNILKVLELELLEI